MGLREMIARQRELTEAARQQGRNLTAEEQREFDGLQARIDAMTGNGQEGGQTAGTGALGEGLEGGGRSGGQAKTAEGGRTAEAFNGQAGNLSGGKNGSQRAVLEERNRIREITALCQRFGLESQKYIERGGFA